MVDIIKENPYKEIEKFINERGCNVRDFLKYECDKNPEILQMSAADQELFCTLYDEVFNPSSTTKSKGNKLEDLTSVLFEKSFSNIFEVKRNCRTSSNEIDLLIRWKQDPKSIGLDCVFGDRDSIFLCECKNYKGKVNVTYIGKFFSLMNYTHTEIGVLVAWEGVTGTGWNAGLGLIKKIALADKKYIIVISKDDLYEIYQKKTSLFKLLKDKYHSLKFDIGYEQYISKHEAEEKILSNIQDV